MGCSGLQVSIFCFDFSMPKSVRTTPPKIPTKGKTKYKDLRTDDKGSELILFISSTK